MMNRRSLIKVLPCVVLALGLVLTGPSVTAQMRSADSIVPAGEAGGDDLRRPPRVEPTDRYNGLVMTLIVIVCVAVTAGAVLIPGQRSHQD